MSISRAAKPAGYGRNLLLDLRSCPRMPMEIECNKGDQTPALP